MLKKMFQYFKNFYTSKAHNFNYYGWDSYGQIWIIKIDQDQQLWTMMQKKTIRNAGYYKPFRKIIMLKYLTRENNICHKN